jgi:hypothetical protein
VPPPPAGWPSCGWTGVEVALAERVAPADTDPRTEAGKIGAALNRMLDHVGGALAWPSSAR